MRDLCLLVALLSAVIYDPIAVTDNILSEPGLYDSLLDGKLYQMSVDAHVCGMLGTL